MRSNLFAAVVLLSTWCGEWAMSALDGCQGKAATRIKLPSGTL